MFRALTYIIDRNICIRDNKHESYVISHVINNVLRFNTMIPRLVKEGW